jgi:MFS family permease
MIAIVVHQIPFFTSSVGLSEGMAAASVTAMTLLSLVGRLGFGQLADTMDKRYVMAIAHALTGLALLLYASVYELAGAVRAADIRAGLRWQHTGAPPFRRSTLA